MASTTAMTQPLTVATVPTLAPEWNQVLGDGYTFSQLINIDSAKIDGIELAGKYQLTPTLYLRANYTYTDARITSGANEGQPLSGTAKHMANANTETGRQRRNSAPTSQLKCVQSASPVHHAAGHLTWITRNSTRTTPSSTWVRATT